MKNHQGKENEWTEGYNIISVKRSSTQQGRVTFFELTVAFIKTLVYYIIRVWYKKVIVEETVFDHMTLFLHIISKNILYKEFDFV
jgi:hypothetical protein